MWARLGADVTVVEFLDNIVPTMVGRRASFQQACMSSAGLHYTASQHQAAFKPVLYCAPFLTSTHLATLLALQDGEVRRSFQRSLQKQGLKFKLGTKVRTGCGNTMNMGHAVQSSMVSWLAR